MRLLVVIVSYRATELTIDCLRSLAGEIGRVPGTRVAVCENGTGGDAEERLRTAIAENGWDTWVDLTAIFPNRGFTGGNNAVIRPILESDDPPEYVLLLNADTLVLEHSLDTLVEFMDDHPKVGIAGSLLLSPNGDKQGSPFRFPGIATEIDRGFRLGFLSKLLTPLITITKTESPCRVDWVAGASMILRRSMLDQIGLLDEGLYTYFDDPDICLRAARAGWETWFVPASRIIHYEGAVTGIGSGRRVQRRLPPYWHQARRRFFLKNHGPWYTALADATFILGYACWRLRRRIQRKPDVDPPHMLGDSIRQSVFRTGFAVPVVENPALRDAATARPEAVTGGPATVMPN